MKAVDQGAAKAADTAEEEPEEIVLERKKKNREIGGIISLMK